MEAQNKSRSSTDAHRRSSDLRPPDAEMLSVVLGKELGGPLTAQSAHAASVKAGCNTNTERYFCFLSFYMKFKNPILEKTGTNIGLS